MRREKDHIVERVYKSLWHVALAAIGAYEYRTHKSKTAKVLAVGMIAFHVDAAIADALDSRPIAKHLLDVALGGKDEHKQSNRTGTKKLPRRPLRGSEHERR